MQTKMHVYVHVYLHIYIFCFLNFFLNQHVRADIKHEGIHRFIASYSVSTCSFVKVPLIQKEETVSTTHSNILGFNSFCKYMCFCWIFSGKHNLSFLFLFQGQKNYVQGFRVGKHICVFLWKLLPPLCVFQENAIFFKGTQFFY